MLGAERRACIVELLNEGRGVRVSTLSTRFAVSQMTIRRDLERLELQGLAVRAYGGAIARR
jgi:DeoR/GlpR family transcriptional regulator of sugar metabolism